MNVADRKVYGYLVFYDYAENKEIHRMAVHSPRDSRTTERVMDGVERQMDWDRVYYQWEDA